MSHSSEELKTRVRGVLAFVCTPFGADGEVDLERFRQHLRYLLDDTPAKPAAFFCCSGTGEFFSLDLAEYRKVVKAAVDEAGAEVPVFAGTGYGTRMAIAFASAAQSEGADGVLVFPPYLISATQEGLYRHCEAIAQAVDLGLVVYSRDNAILEPATTIRLAQTPNIIGLKDGFGDMDSVAQVRRELGDSFLLMNGMPLADRYAPAYLALGVPSYSPGALDFLPEVTWAFYQAMLAGNQAEMDRLLQGFFNPFAELRALGAGYGISLVKAGLRLRDRPAGGVRLPLVDPTPEHEALLGDLITGGLALLSSEG